MAIRFSLGLLGLVFISPILWLPATMPAQDSPPSAVVSDAKGQAIHERMLATIQAAQTMSYRSHYQWASNDNVLGKAEVQIWLKKPHLARMEAKPVGGEVAGIYVADGQDIWIYWPNGRPQVSSESPEEHARSSKQVYLREPFLAKRFSISHKAPYLGAGTSMLVHQPSEFHGYVGSLKPYFDGVRFVGTEKIDGEECDLIELSYAKGQRQHRIWVAQRDHLPRLLRETVHTARIITAEERWTDVKLNESIPDERFTWQPPAGWQEWRMPGIEAALLPPGTSATNFAFKSAEDGTISLADFKGKVVWLVFWRVGCPPCRVEFPYLEKLHRHHGSQDLVILGFNAMDDAAIAKEFLKEHGITFPNILDSSPEAQRINAEVYQRGVFAVPLNYLIDREGKIVLGWYGYEKDDPRPEQELKKLGIK
ncbi:MAG TPA: redoxin family protein [Gemmatales bacterium]|nr:redoxin family protein [Gemmatales bacterium]